MNDTDEPELSARDAARVIGVHVSTLGRYARAGQVRFRTLPSGQRRYRRSELEADLETAHTEDPDENQP